MTDKLYAVDLGELGTMTGTLDQMNNMMRMLNQAGLFATGKEEGSDDQATRSYYHDCWNTSCDAHCKIWDAIKEDYMKEVEG